MPKIAGFPRLRTHTRTGSKNGQTWTSYWWDGRSDGLKDIPLGTDYETAIGAWREIERRRANAFLDDAWKQTLEIAAAGLSNTADLIRIALSASDVRPTAGIYFLFDANNAIIYIGQSDNVMRRMAGHMEKPILSVRMVACPDVIQRLGLERQFIAIFRPALNVHLVPSEQQNAA